MSAEQPPAVVVAAAAAVAGHWNMNVVSAVGRQLLLAVAVAVVAVAGTVSAAPVLAAPASVADMTAAAAAAVAAGVGVVDGSPADVHQLAVVGTAAGPVGSYLNEVSVPCVETAVLR